MTARLSIVLVLFGFSAATGCSHPVPRSGSIVGVSQTVTVRGNYSPVALDRVDRLSLEGGKLILHGSSSTVTVDPPPAADPAKPDPHWALATERLTDTGRIVTFTHDMSLDDFSIELPRSEAPLRFGGFSGRDGNDVLIVAWGENSRSFLAELTISAPDSRRGTPP
jgi:hypothetical protein